MKVHFLSDMKKVDFNIWYNQAKCHSSKAYGLTFYTNEIKNHHFENV